MAEKEKKVTVREVMREKLAVMLMKEMGLEKMGRTKEGLVVKVGEETLVVRVILKKEKVETKDVVEVLELAKLEEEGEDGEEEEEEEEISDIVGFSMDKR